MAVFRIDRFGPSGAAATAARERLSAMVRARRPARRGRQGPRPLILGLEIALVVALGFVLWRIIWLGLGPIAPPPAPPAPVVAPAGEVPAGANPFRTASAPEAAPVVDTGADLAETTLNLALHGTWTDGKGGVAIIKTSDEKQGRFAVGDTITNGVTLERVYRDHVVIIRNGVREALSLVNRDSLAAAMPAAEAAPAAEGAAAPVDGMAAIGDFVIAMPAPDEVGGLSLVLQPADDPKEFEALGLRAGDRLVAVDNQPIDRDIARGLEAIAMSEGKQSVTLSVERDGVVMPVTIGLPTETVAMPQD